MTIQDATLPANQRGRLGNLLSATRRSVASVLLGMRGFLGRHLSVRWKLTLWYGLMCAATLGGLGLVMRGTLDQRVRTSIDSSLRSTAAKLQRDLSRPLRPNTKTPLSNAFRAYTGQVQKALLQSSFPDSQPGQFEQVEISRPESPTGCLIQSRRSAGCSGLGVPLPSAQFLRVSEVASTARPDISTVAINGTTYRLYLAPLYPPRALRSQGVSGVLEVFQNESNYNNIRRWLDLIWLFGIPLALILALAVGWWIARAALRPIDRISRTVRAIGESGDLTRRVNFRGPSDEVGRLAVTFDTMMERLEKVFETQRRFVADASHELRTPLTAIRGNADLLSIAPPAERDVCVTAIRRESERMSRLVADLLLLAAADIEEQPVHMQLTNLQPVLEEVHRSAQVIAGGKLTIRYESEPVTICADPDRIKQLVLNLVDNALKFTPHGGTVAIRLRAEAEGARIEVCDTGEGIPPEDRRAIFERFYRVDEARVKRGSGLGLAISSWIVSAHGGRIEVQSELGEGSTFIVHLPSGISADGQGDRAAADRAAEVVTSQS